MKYRVDYCCNSSSSSFVCQRNHSGIVTYDSNEGVELEGFKCRECSTELSHNLWITPTKEQYSQIVLEEIFNNQNNLIKNQYFDIFLNNYDYWVNTDKKNAAEVFATQIAYCNLHSYKKDFTTFLQNIIENDHLKKVECDYSYHWIHKDFCPYCTEKIISEFQYIKALLSQNKHLLIYHESSNSYTLNENIFKEEDIESKPYRTCDIVSLCINIISMKKAKELINTEEYNSIILNEYDFSYSDKKICIEF